MTGQKFNKLTVVGLDCVKNGQAYWRCRCDCGAETSVKSYNLISGNTKACGCFQAEAASIASTKHGMCKSREYRIWIAMKGRCQNPKDSGYRYYGARGIKVAPEFQTFEGFFAFIGKCPPKSSIDRIDNNGHYAPGNVRWTDRRTQMRNTRANHRYEYQGRNLTLVEWAEHTGLTLSCLTGRLRLGWSLEQVLTTPKLGGPSKARTELGPA